MVVREGKGCWDSSKSEWSFASRGVCAAARAVCLERAELVREVLALLDLDDDIS